MGIIQAPYVLPGQVGIIGAIKYMTTTDGLTTLTTAGYLNQVDLAVNPIAASDVLGVTYSYNVNTNIGTFDFFTVTISNGVITLVADVANGDVLLPVVSNDFASFNGTSGQIKDAGYSPTDAAKTKVVMADAATVANHIMVSTDTAGTVGNRTGTAINDGTVQAGRSSISGALVSFPTTASKGSLAVVAVANTGDTVTTISNQAMGQASVVSIPDPAAATATFVVAPSALVSGNLVKASGTAGLVVDQGVAMKSVGIAAVSGGAAAQTVTDAFCTSTSCVIACWNDTTNAVTIQKVAADNGSFVVTSSGDPGASHISYIITK